MSDNSPLRVAIAGLGTVGTGTARLLVENAGLLAARCGRPLELVAVADLDRNRDRGVDLSDVTWFDDALEMASSADADLMVELIGGSSGIALDLCRASLTRGLHVVTANKAMLAHHGLELASLAEKKGVALGYEAAVAGGIPIIKALRESLVGNRIERITGILNGTCNYILTAMRKSGRSFEDVLGEAQEKGYAEADPTFDVDGVDAAHKLTLLTSLAYGVEPDFDHVHMEGIRHVSSLDISYAEELGYRIKLLGITRKTDRGIEQRVHPALVPQGSPLAHVEDVLNAVAVDGDFVGPATFVGRGAGMEATASAVVGDIADVARGLISPVFGVPASRLAPADTADMSGHRGAYYVRLTAEDKSGVIADVSAIFRDEGISMESMLQHGRGESRQGPVFVVMTTHETVESAMSNALEKIAALSSMIDAPRMIRIEDSME